MSIDLKQKITHSPHSQLLESKAMRSNCTGFSNNQDPRSVLLMLQAHTYFVANTEVTDPET